MPIKRDKFYNYCYSCKLEKKSVVDISKCPKCDEAYKETASDIKDLLLAFDKDLVLPAGIPLSKKFKNGNKEVSVGRSKDYANVVIPLITLAPKHCMFCEEGGRIEIRDTRDEYPTYVNGCLMEQSHILAEGDRIVIGGITYIFTSGDLQLEQTKRGSLVHLKDLSFGYRGGKEDKALISNLKAIVQPGKSVVIRGESGCGKSTLLEFIAGQLGTDSSGFWSKGRCRIRSKFKDVVAYVPQDPVLPDGLTVFEMFRLFAHLYKVQAPVAETNYILSALGLDVKNKQNKRVERLSGGEKRRVHIGIELLRKPTLLLIDEPDSHLDKENRLRTLLHLAALKYSGVTIIATSHSPECEDFFDDLLVLDRECEA